MHIRTVLLASAMAFGVAAPAVGQVNAYSADAYAKPVYDGYKSPKNGFGQPDIAGVWSNATTTPVERRAEHKSLVLTEEEAAKVQGAAETYRRAGDVRVLERGGAGRSASRRSVAASDGARGRGQLRHGRTDIAHADERGGDPSLPRRADQADGPR